VAGLIATVAAGKGAIKPAVPAFGWILGLGGTEIVLGALLLSKCGEEVLRTQIFSGFGGNRSRGEDSLRS